MLARARKLRTGDGLLLSTRHSSRHSIVHGIVHGIVHVHVALCSRCRVWLVDGRGLAEMLRQMLHKFLDGLEHGVVVYVCLCLAPGQPCQCPRALPFRLHMNQDQPTSILNRSRSRPPPPAPCSLLPLPVPLSLPLTLPLPLPRPFPRVSRDGVSSDGTHGVFSTCSRLHLVVGTSRSEPATRRPNALSSTTTTPPSIQ